MDFFAMILRKLKTTTRLAVSLLNCFGQKDNSGESTLLLSSCVQHETVRILEVCSSSNRFQAHRFMICFPKAFSKL